MADNDLEGFEKWRRSLCYWTGLGLTDGEKTRYEENQRKRKIEMQCKKCIDSKDRLLAYSPIVRFMKENVELVKGNMDETSIVCRHCDKHQSGGFHPNLGIVLCFNRLRNEKQVEDTLAHEMVHAYDHCRFEVDWANLRHHACSEIRAASLSGECRWTREIGRSYFTFINHHQECVRRRATLSVAAHPNCKDDAEAARIVNQVFETCFADTRPFAEIYR